MTRRTRGFTLIEVIVAVAILLTASLVLVSVTSTALRSASTTDARTQLASVMAFFGREVVGGDARVLPDVDASLTWAYGEVLATFPELSSTDADVLDPGAYRAVIESDGEVDVVGAVAVRYLITVCTMAEGSERCLDAVTFGPAPAPDAANSLLPGIN